MYKYFTCYHLQVENIIIVVSITHFDTSDVAWEEVSYAWLCEDKMLLLNAITVS